MLELLGQYRHFSWTGYRLGDAFLDIRSVYMDDPKGYRWNWKCRGLEISTDITGDTETLPIPGGVLFATGVSIDATDNDVYCTIVYSDY